MREKNILLLVNNINEYFPEDTNRCYIYKLFKGNSYLSRVFRKIIMKSKSDLIYFLIRHWIGEVKKCDVIIVFDTGNADGITSYLSKKYPEKRIILWYWNPVKRSISPLKIEKDLVEIWSFDEEDCKEYGFSYNTQFYFNENLYRADSNLLCEDDVFFIGVDKGRKKELDWLAKKLEKKSLSYTFYLVKSKSQEDIDQEFSGYRPALKYPQILGLIKGVKAIVDIVSDDQNGLTLRPLEALFFKKKLITNMKSIEEFDLYNKNNIFILDKDDPDDLYDFVNSPFDESTYADMIRKYDFDSWVDRFIN